jgi:hypothetical protein
MLQPHAPLSAVYGLGQTYAVQTAKACGCASGRGTLTDLVQKVVDVVTHSSAPALAVIEFLTKRCAANPRAGQMTDTAYVIPEFNLFVARSLLNVLRECLAFSSSFPVLAAHATQVRQAVEAADTMLPPVQPRRKQRSSAVTVSTSGGLL